MRPRERIELGLIAAVVLVVIAAGRSLPVTLHAGVWLTTLCLVWLVQGALRDLWILMQMRRHPSPKPTRRLPCMCLESSVGLVGVLVGVACALLEKGGAIQLSPVRWSGALAVVLFGGFALRDWVITWRPLGIRREPDHHGIIVSWR